MLQDLPIWSLIDTPIDSQSGSLLKSTFKTLRSEVFDNKFITGDTIALSYGDLFLSTGSNPLRMAHREDITENNFWVTPTFSSRDKGIIGLRKWPELNTLKAGEWWTRKGAVI